MADNAPDPGIIAPQEAVFHLTLRCPLRCAHCCVYADIDQTAALELPEVLRAMDEAARLGTVKMVHFVGGDPFMHPALLREATAHAAGLGLAVGATTSGFWASSEPRALALLAPLVQAGFTRLTLSYDDPHAEFVREERIVNAFRAAQALELETLVAVVRDEGWRIDAAYMARLLGIPLEGTPTARIYETAVNSTGRAKDTATPETLERRRHNPLAYRGPCNSVLREISVLSDGSITACCGVIPPREPLRIGRVGDTPLNEAVEAAYGSLLLKWLAFEGPVAILRQITAGTEHPLADEDFDGICHACDVLFSEPRHMELLERALPAKAPELMLQEEIFSLMGVYQPPVPAGAAEA